MSNQVTSRITKGVFLAFDFGMKRIGTAIGQMVTQSARPLETLRAKDGEPQWSDVARLINNWHPEALIVGIPRMMDDTPQFTTQAATAFAEQLKNHTHLPIHKVDERLSTKAAREQLFEEGGYQALQQGDIDCYAAKIILEQWLRLNTI